MKYINSIKVKVKADGSPSRRWIGMAMLLLALSVPSIAVAAYDGDSGPDRTLAFGNAQDLGAPANSNAPLVGIASTKSGNGYWIVASDGGVFSFGDAPFYGSLGASRLNAPIIDIAATTTGNGYWLVATDGGVFSFGDAEFFGSTGAVPLNEPVVSLLPTASGRGYWLIARDGGVFTFGDAQFYGSGFGASEGDFVGAVRSPSGNGYALAANDGGVFTFGDAPFLGSMPRASSEPRINAMTPTPDSGGYWLTGADGGVFTFGNAPFFGSAPGKSGDHPAVALTARRDGSGYVMLIGDQPKSAGGGRYIGTISATWCALSGRTASGAMVSDNVVAVDRKVIPLGTRLYIDGVGYRTALDTGGVIIGQKLDIWKSSTSACMQWGRRPVKVYIV